MKHRKKNEQNPPAQKKKVNICIYERELVPNVGKLKNGDVREMKI